MEQSKNNLDDHPTPVGTPRPQEPGNAVTVAVSTAFPSDATGDAGRPDVVIVSSDEVFFHVHHHRLFSVSLNGFNYRLSHTPDAEPNPEILILPQTASVINVVLHTIYDRSCSTYSPDFHTVVAAIDALKQYGVPLQSYMARNTPLYTLLLSHAPLHPIEAYAVAAFQGLEDLAVAISSHLLGFQVTTLTDELAIAIGPIYLKRLLVLLHNRLEFLKRLVFSPPYPHGPGSNMNGVLCDSKAMNRAWAMASAQLAWEGRPDVSASYLESCMGSLGAQLTCHLCRECLNKRVKEIVVQWSLADRTI